MPFASERIRIREGKSQKLTLMLDKHVTTGSIRVLSTPTGAKWYLDGDYMGVTPDTAMSIKPGNHSIKVVQSGYDGWERQVRVSKGDTAQITADLARLSQSYSLTVNATPADARIRILNIAPTYTPGMELEAGRYNIEVSKPGYETWRDWIELNAGHNTFMASLNKAQSRVYPLAASVDGDGTNNKVAQGKATAKIARLSRGLVAYFPFNGNTNDASGHGRNGIVHGNITYSAGVDGSSAFFNGENAYIDVGDSATLNLVRQLSISLWIKTTSVQKPWSRLISKENPNVGNRQFYLGINGGDQTGKVRTVLDTTDGRSPSMLGNTVITDGEWHSLAMTFDSASYKIYVDGRLEGSTPCRASNVNVNAVLRIGEVAHGLSNMFYFGQIDEVRIYNRAIEEDEIAYLSAHP